MKKQLLIVGLMLGCGMQLHGRLFKHVRRAWIKNRKKITKQIGKKLNLKKKEHVEPKLPPKQVDKDLLHVGLELKKAMNSDIFKKQLQQVVAEVFTKADLSPSQTQHTFNALSLIKKEMPDEFEEFNKVKTEYKENPRITKINEQLKGLRKQGNELYENKEYKELIKKLDDMKHVHEYRKKNYGEEVWKAQNKKVEMQLAEKFPEYKKIQEQIDQLNTELKPVTDRQEEIYAKLRELRKKEKPRVKKDDDSESQKAKKAEKALKKELEQWPTQEIFTLDDIKVFFGHAKLIVNTAVQTLSANLITGDTMPEQSPEEMMKDRLEAGLKIKQALTADSVTEKIKEMVQAAVEQADINVAQAKKSYKSVNLVSNLLQKGVDSMMLVRHHQIDPEQQALYDELDMIRKKHGKKLDKSWELTLQSWKVKGVREEAKKLRAAFREQRETALKEKFPDYAQVVEQMKPYKDRSDKIVDQKMKLYEEKNEIFDKEMAQREQESEASGDAKVRKEMQQWPMGQIIKMPSDLGIILEHARLIIGAAGKVLERKAIAGTGVA